MLVLVCDLWHASTGRWIIEADRKIERQKRQKKKERQTNRQTDRQTDRLLSPASPVQEPSSIISSSSRYGPCVNIPRKYVVIWPVFIIHSEIYDLVIKLLALYFVFSFLAKKLNPGPWIYRPYLPSSSTPHSD